MADMMDTLKGLLGDDADSKLNGIMSALKTEDSAPPELPAAGAAVPELLLQAQGLIRQLSSAGGDNRTGLLMSLKPYMRPERRNTIDNAVKLLNIARLAELFGRGMADV